MINFIIDYSVNLINRFVYKTVTKDIQFTPRGLSKPENIQIYEAGTGLKTIH